MRKPFQLTTGSRVFFVEGKRHNILTDSELTASGELNPQISGPHNFGLKFSSTRKTRPTHRWEYKFRD